MAKYTTTQVFTLLEKLSEEDVCTQTTDRLWIEFFGKADQETGKYWLIKDYQLLNRVMSYPRFVASRIREELNLGGICSIHLGLGEKIGHSFTLIKTVDNKVFRIESYIDIYCTRIVQWPTYFNDIISLLEMTPGVARLNYWNGLFSSMEKEGDDEYPIIVTLKAHPLVFTRLENGDYVIKWKNRQLSIMDDEIGAIRELEKYRRLAPHFI